MGALLVPRSVRRPTSGTALADRMIAPPRSGAKMAVEAIDSASDHALIGHGSQNRRLDQCEPGTSVALVTPNKLLTWNRKFPSARPGKR